MGQVIVVGAGVVGLTCAVRLLEAGHRVDVLARDLPLETTSAVAGAIWYPYRAKPRERVSTWARTSYAALAVLGEDPDSGVRMLDGTEVHTRATPDPWWAGCVPSLDRETALPDGYVDGWTFRAPVVEMPVHLRWLHDRVEELGGTVTRLNLGGLPPAPGSLVVDCAGLGARLMADDSTVVPVRGQVVHVEQVGLDRWCLDAAAPTYVLPRSHDVVLGGTDQEGEWSRTPSSADAEAILARARALVPGLAGARVLRHRVGLRPWRPEVRLEREGDVIHCYGHGGAGVTLAWGCADEVASLA